MDQQDILFYIFIYLFHNFHVHSTCFEKSCRSSSRVYHSVLYYTALHNRANVSSCSWTNSWTYSALFSQLRSNHFRSDQRPIYIESRLCPSCNMAATFVRF